MRYFYSIVFFGFVSFFITNCSNKNEQIIIENNGFNTECGLKNIYQLIDSIESFELDDKNNKEKISFINYSSFGGLSYYGLSKKGNKIIFRDAYFYPCSKDSSQIELKNFCNQKTSNFCINSFTVKQLSKREWRKTINTFNTKEFKLFNPDTSCMILDGSAYIISIRTKKVNINKAGESCEENEELLLFGEDIMKYSDFDDYQLAE